MLGFLKENIISIFIIPKYPHKNKLRWQNSKTYGQHQKKDNITP